MWLILLSIIGASALSFVLLVYSDEGHYVRHGFAFVLGVVGVVASIASWVIWLVAIWEWIGAEYKADILNREYGTNYTREELFWAKDVIDTVRELDRKRVEVNGNLLKTED